MRIDKYLVDKGIIATRSRAELVIKKGYVKVDGLIVTKPSYTISDNSEVELLSDLKYASQGGYKLQLAIEQFNINCTEKVCIDIGASNGGFTDCLLKSGAAKVYAVDVAHCALSDDLVNDKRVVVKDNINARYLTFNNIGERADIITVDVSYISIKLVIPNLTQFLSPEGVIIALIKPQFEAGKKALNKKGIVKDKATHIQILKDIKDYVESINLNLIKTIKYQPFEREKNIEYLALIASK